MTLAEYAVLTTVWLALFGGLLAATMVTVLRLLDRVRRLEIEARWTETVVDEHGIIYSQLVREWAK